MLPVRTNNPLAPAAYNGLSSITEQYSDDMVCKAITITLTASQNLLNQTLPLDRDADFVWLATRLVGGEVSTRFSDSSGYFVNDQYLGAMALSGSTTPGDGIPVVLPIPYVMPAGSALLIDVQEQSGAANVVQYLIWGLKRYRN